MTAETMPTQVLEQRVSDNCNIPVSSNPKTDTQSIHILGHNTRDDTSHLGYHWHHQLNEDERNLDRGDAPFFEIIDAMSKEEWNSVNRVLAQKLDSNPNASSHYFVKQKEWINYAREQFRNKYLAQHGVIPTDDIFLDHTQEKGLFERYKVFYVAKYFDRTEINNGLNHPRYGPVTSEDLRIAEDFIADIMDVRRNMGLAFVSD